MNTSIYAKPVAPRIVLRPALATLLLHGLMIYLLTVNWAATEERDITRVKPAPRVINARLVDVSELKPKKEIKKIVKKTVTKAPRVKAPTPRKTVTKAPAAKTPVVKKTDKPRKIEPVAKPEPKITQEELAAIARADLSRAMAEEEQVQAAATATADEMAASFAALIQQTVINYWSRPPSARNGMEALLAIQLIPTGEVVSVSVLKSSGNAAFDRSAINAVEKAGSFPELQKLPTREFEKTFRRFRLLFRPEDLRY